MYDKYANVISILREKEEKISQQEINKLIRANRQTNKYKISEGERERTPHLYTMYTF